jgi:hypothetical protein
MAILGGKALGLGLCLLLIFAASTYFSCTSKVYAQTASPTVAETTASPIASVSPAVSPAQRPLLLLRRQRPRTEPALCQPNQYDLGAGHGVPRFLHASRIYVS